MFFLLMCIVIDVYLISRFVFYGLYKKSDAVEEPEHGTRRLFPSSIIEGLIFEI